MVREKFIQGKVEKKKSWNGNILSSFGIFDISP